MKRLIYLFVIISLVSCTQYVDKPKNLIDESTMTELIAELAINEQVVFIYQGKNLESGTRFILKSKNIKPDDFVESYKYYVASRKMNDIADNAQQLILDKDPKAEKFVKDKLGENKNVPPFAR